MGWQFWKRDSKNGHGTEGRRRTKPKELPYFIGKYLVTDKNLDPDWVWALKAVSRPREGKKSEYDIRVFDPARSIAVDANIRCYEDLDARPELVLFHGWYDKVGSTFELLEPQRTGEKAA